ncbi:MAG: transketolase [Gammaproteobacteria bacterium]
MPDRRKLANAIRALSMDAVQKANSGHPGAPMGMADIAEVLWNDFLKHNPDNPNWPDRDRFVMSNGHGSMLLYSLLHLSGYDLPMEELQRFRQLHSKTPGHPEFGCTAGVETTTGPLGQGLANAVGMALAERTLAAQFNQPEHDIVDHYTYVSVGDGCLMEGLSHEACSYAGTLGLGKLIAIYDSNRISIDGDIDGWFTEDVAQRFRAYNWQVIEDVDGHDVEAIHAAITKARGDTEHPSLICCHTLIAWGAPGKQGKASSHGAPLGEDEISRAREALGWSHKPFVIPDKIYAAWNAGKTGKKNEADWQKRFDRYTKAFPELAAEFQRRTAAALPENWDAVCDAFITETNGKQESIATRKASQNCLEAYAPILPELIGGSADLTGSNLTTWSGSSVNSATVPDGNYLHYGVREFAMAAINSGIALHGGFIPYGGTFLMFSEYARNALRMASLMKQRSLFILTHDSIGLGEDGPTHQAVEQAATLRLLPGMSVWRPGDATETAVAWRRAIENRHGPSCLLLSRQSLPFIAREAEQIAAIGKGGYVLIDSDGPPQLIVIATGSELGPAKAAVEALGDSSVRLVSMPSCDVFDQQDAAYREQVLPTACRKRIAVEAGIPDYWRKYVGLDGEVLGVPGFGESAPAAEVFEHFGITTEGIVKMIKSYRVADY